MLTNPRYQIYATERTILIDTDDQVDQDDYSASEALTLGDGVRPVSGEILSAVFFAWEEGTGAVQTPAGTLLLLSADPAVSAGDTAITAAERVTVIGHIEVAATDWISDANGASAFIYNQPVPFHNLQTLYAVWFHEDATSLNDGAGDDELLAVQLWYRRDT